MTGQLLSAVPGQGLAELLGKRGHRCRQRGVHRDGAVATEGRTVLHRRPLAPPLQSRQVHQDRGAAAALDERADRGPAGPDDQVAFPMPWDSTVFGFGGAFADHHVRGDMSLRLVLRSATGHPQCPAGAQACDQLPCQGASTFDVQRSVDRLVTDAHGLILREINFQPVRDLFRAPCRRPPSVLPMRLVQSFPRGRVGACDGGAVGPADGPGEPLLHILTQPVVVYQLRRFRAFRGLLRFPLRHSGSVDLRAAAGRRVAAQLA